MTKYFDFIFSLSLIKRKGRKKTIEETTNFRIGIFTYYRLCRKEYGGIAALKLWSKKCNNSLWADKNRSKDPAFPEWKVEKTLPDTKLINIEWKKDIHSLYSSPVDTPLNKKLL